MALPLHPEYGTEPNVFYVPPILPPNFDAEGRFDEENPRVPMEYLRYLFGPQVDARADHAARGDGEEEGGQAVAS